MPTTRQLMTIHDDQFGEGPDLAFPTMSTCSAIICVLANGLLGIHKTQGWTAVHPRLFTAAQTALAGRAVSALYVAGWNASNAAFHDIAQIQTALGIGTPPTYAHDYHNTWRFLPWAQRRPGKRTEMAYSAGPFVSKTTDLCTFALGNGVGQHPTIGVKRTQKVHVQSDPTAYGTLLAAHGAANARFHASVEDVTTPSTHLHLPHFRLV